MPIFVSIEAPKAKISPIFADFILPIAIFQSIKTPNILTNTPNFQLIPIALTFQLSQT